MGIDVGSGAAVAAAAAASWRGCRLIAARLPALPPLRAAPHAHASRKVALRCRGPPPDAFRDTLLAAVAAMLAAGPRQQQQAGAGGRVDPVVLQAIVDMVRCADCALRAAGLPGAGRGSVALLARWRTRCRAADAKPKHMHLPDTRPVLPPAGL